MDINAINKKELKPFFEALGQNADDMQALLTRGYKSLPAARYLLLQITDEKEAKKYLNILADKFITKAKKQEKQLLTKNGDPRTAVNIAFTSGGLKKLGVSEKTLKTFSREFHEGMNYQDPSGLIPSERSTLLGDRGKSDPSNWYWGNKKNPVHCLLMLFAETGPILNLLFDFVYTQYSGGVCIVHSGETFEYEPNHKLKEHFGFQDGISQPILRGLSKSDLDSVDDSQLINPGEIILGLKNEYDNYSPMPYEETVITPNQSEKINLGENGTYLVFRQIEQHVEEFWKFQYENSVEAGVSQHEKAITLGAKMVGRWPEGQPLVTYPDGECPRDHASLNNFTYAGLDKYGTKCPLGAHIRRANPRDQVHTGRGPQASLIMSKRHRMLRRGRIYGCPLAQNFNIDTMICKSINPQANCTEDNNNCCAPKVPSPGPGQTKINRGLHFICLVSDIGRQFEFVQNVWSNTPTFADLRNQSDPIISPKSAIDQLAVNEFTTPNDAIRNRYSVPEFTTVIGGDYFFMPSLTILKHFSK